MADPLSSCFRDLRLESKSLGEAWLNLNDDLTQLEKHKSQLKEEWRQLENQRSRLKRERSRFENMVKQEWFPNQVEKTESGDEEEEKIRIIKLNVGGQLFEVSSKLLVKDRFSLLAAVAVAEEDSILQPEEDGSFYFDRDWWLFKHILAFLRDKVLPDKDTLLRDLFHEAAFYCLSSMQREILVLLTERKQKKKKTQQQIYEDSIRAKIPTKLRKQRQQKSKRSKSLSSDLLPDPFGFTSNERRKMERAATIL